MREAGNQKSWVSLQPRGDRACPGNLRAPGKGQVNSRKPSIPGSPRDASGNHLQKRHPQVLQVRRAGDQRRESCRRAEAQGRLE